MNNDITIYDLLVDYEENDYYELLVDGNKILLKYDVNGVTFIKENNESIFKIDYDDNIGCRMSLKLKEQKAEVDLPIENFEYNYDNGNILICYSIEEGILNTISFSTFE